MTTTIYGSATFNADGVIVGNYDGGAYAFGFVRAVGETLTTDDFRIASFNNTSAVTTGTVVLVDSDVTVASDLDGDQNDINVGAFGSGEPNAIATLVISEGSAVTSIGNPILSPGADMGSSQGTYSGLNVGRNGAVGLVHVTGTDAQSSLTIRGDGNRVTFGRDDGTGTLLVEDNATVGFRNADIGRDGIGSIHIRGDAGGPVPLVHASNLFGEGPYQAGGLYSTVGAYVQFGRGDSYNGQNPPEDSGFGELIIEEAGELRVSGQDGYTNDGATLRFGRDDNSVGIARVNGANAVVNVLQYGTTENEFGNGARLQIGRDGEGVFTLSGGAQLNVLGDQALVEVGARDNTTTEQDFTSTLSIQTGAVATISGTDPNGGDYAGGYLVVGRDGSRGEVTVSGAGSELNLSSNATGDGENAAFLTVGRDGGIGSLSVRAGADVTIDGNSGSFPGLRAGQGDGGEGRVKVFGEGSTITINGSSTESAFAGGILSIGRDAGSYGRLDIQNGADVAVTGPNSGGSAGLRDGSEGRINVFGTGSTLDAGETFFLGGNVDSNAIDNGSSLADAFDPFDGGRGRLVVRDGASFEADETFVGASGLFDVEGTVTGNVTSFGDVQIGSDDVSSVTITGDASIERDSELEFDVLSDGSSDFLQVDGALDLFIEGVVKIDITDGLSIAAGTRFVLAEATGGITIDPISNSLTVFTDVPDEAFSLEVQGNQLIAVSRDPGELAPLLVGGPGDDVITGTDAGETLEGNGGNDTLEALGGDDVLIGGAGGDSLDGGEGIDTASYETSDSRVQADLLGTTVTIGDAVGDSFADIENLTGSRFNDVLRGDTGDNVITGLGATDRIFGRGGDDTIAGGNGTDIISGNSGADVMTGGNGLDRFIYFNLSDSGVGAGNRDVITDFKEVGADRIEISRLDANANQGGNQVFDFIGNAGFSNTAGELRAATQNGNTVVQADLDGDGASDFEIELTGIVALAASDFVL